MNKGGNKIKYIILKNKPGLEYSYPWTAIPQKSRNCEEFKWKKIKNLKLLGQNKENKTCMTKEKEWAGWG